VDSWEEFKDNGGTLFNNLTINNLDIVTDQIKTSKNNLTFGLEGTSVGYNMSQDSFSPNFLSIGGDNPVLGTMGYPFQDLILRNIGSVRDAIIVETGSNTNGRYVKFGDGTMICYHIFGSITTSNTIGSGYYSSNTTWTFPTTFVTTPPRIFALGSNLTIASGGSNSISSGVFNLFSLDSASRVGGAQVFAIGRWK